MSASSLDILDCRRSACRLFGSVFTFLQLPLVWTLILSS